MRALVVLLLAGCAGTRVPGLDPLRPELRLEDIEVERVTLDAVEADLVFAIENPYPFELDLTRLSWTLVLADALQLDGQRAGAPLAAEAVSRLEVPLTVRWADLLPAIGTFASGDRLPWTLTGAGTFDTPAGPVRVPFEADGTLAPIRRPGGS